MLKQDLEKTSAKHAARAGEITAHLREAATRVRQLARGLSPVDRDEEGLESAFDELAVNTTKLTGISCSFVCSGRIQDLSGEAAIHLFRIAQEAVNNAVNHSHGRSIIVALDATDGSCSLRVSDDGRGFIDSPSDRKGMGLSTMQYRSRMLGLHLARSIAQVIVRSRSWI
jgi:two-component system, LuxR family, sensor kinase FixL